MTAVKKESYRRAKIHIRKGGKEIEMKGKKMRKKQ